MDNKEKVLVIIPAYNEETVVAEVIKSVQKNVPGVDIITINDGSKDMTARVAQKAGSKVINLPFNMGYGVALQTGYKYALENNYQYVVQLDADGQHNPKYINELLTQVQSGKADVVIGSRFLGEGGYKVSRTRRGGMFLFGSIASFITGQRITDPTSGYQAVNREALCFCVSDVYPYDYPDADTIIMLHFAGFKVREVPMKMFLNKKVRTMHSGIKPLYYIFKMFLSIFVSLLREKPYKKRRKKCL
ncbi:MAG: glycosyltransferase family 2 protein [Candidatus Omnitrophica bacterium]|nr:glycosyltransferase family 2 protein [Candidatus Omnitrophota bacterium]